MAITQSRMLALIRAADAFRKQHINTEKYIRTRLAELPAPLTIEDALLAIQDIQQYLALASVPSEFYDNLAAERAHFAANAARNERHARHARQKRGLSDSYNPSRSTAPVDISSKLDSTYLKHIAKDLRKPSGPNLTPEANPALVAGLDESLANQKLEINKFYTAMGQPEPYPDFVNDDEPLSNEHRRHLGLPVEDDGELF